MLSSLLSSIASFQRFAWVTVYLVKIKALRSCSSRHCGSLLTNIRSEQRPIMFFDTEERRQRFRFDFSNAACLMMSVRLISGYVNLGLAVLTA